MYNLLSTVTMTKEGGVSVSQLTLPFETLVEAEKAYKVLRNSELRSPGFSVIHRSVERLYETPINS